MSENFEAHEADIENIESEEDFESSLMDFQNLSLTASDWTTETLYGQIAKGNIDLKPSFQRREVWSTQKKAAFIESLMLGIPVPQIVLAQKQGMRGKYIVLDGKQRLLSILGFYEGEYPLRSIGLLNEIRGLTYEGLDEEWRDSLDNATIRAVRLSGWNSDSVLYTIFHRLNMGSVSLNTQELRSALFPGSYTSFAEQLTSSDLSLARLFSSNANSADFRMRDVELLTRYCGITLKPGLFRGNLKEFLDDVTKVLNDKDDLVLYRTCASNVSETIALYSDIYGEIDVLGKRPIPPFSLIQEGKTPRFNRAVFDALSFAAQDKHIRTSIGANRKAVKERLIQTLSDSRFIDACSLSTKTRSSLISRVGIWSSALASVLNVPVRSLHVDSEGVVCEYELS